MEPCHRPGRKERKIPSEQRRLVCIPLQSDGPSGQCAGSDQKGHVLFDDICVAEPELLPIRQDQGYCFGRDKQLSLLRLGTVGGAGRSAGLQGKVL